MINWFSARGPTPFNGERLFFSTNGARIIRYSNTKEWICTPTSHQILKWIKDLTVRYKTLRGKHKCKSLWPSVRQQFLNYDTKSTKNKRIKKKIHWISLKLKIFVHPSMLSRKTIHEMREIMANPISDKGLIFKYVFKK